MSPARVHSFWSAALRTYLGHTEDAVRAASRSYEGERATLSDAEPDFFTAPIVRLDQQTEGSITVQVARLGRH